METYGDKKDVAKVVKQALNASAANRLISKQECCVLLGQMDLVNCSERIKCISLSGGKRIKIQEKDQKDKTFIEEYITRPQDEENLSVHEFYMKHKHVLADGSVQIPHYVGIKGKPTYPIEEPYARAVCLIHIPWRRVDNKRDFISEFKTLLKSELAPLRVKLDFHRVYNRYLQKKSHCEPVSKEYDLCGNPVNMSDVEIMYGSALPENSVKSGKLHECLEIADSFFRGEDGNYDWSKEYSGKVRLRHFRI